MFYMHAQEFIKYLFYLKAKIFNGLSLLDYIIRVFVLFASGETDHAVHLVIINKFSLSLKFSQSIILSPCAVGKLLG